MVVSPSNENIKRKPKSKLAKFAKTIVMGLIATATFTQSAYSWEIRTHILSPTREGAMAWHVNDRWGFCVDLPLRGLHDFTGIGTQLVTGYSYQYFQGADPFPCNEKQNRFYQAMVNFDLSGIRPVSVVSAHLELQGEELAFRAPASGQACWFQVSQADEGWRTGNRRTTSESGLVDTTGPRVFHNMARPTTRRFQRHSIDVTRMISRITNNDRLQRQGFVIEATRNRMNQNENAACVRAFTLPRLWIRTLEF